MSRKLRVAVRELPCERGKGVLHLESESAVIGEQRRCFAVRLPQRRQAWCPHREQTANRLYWASLPVDSSKEGHVG